MKRSATGLRLGLGVMLALVLVSVVGAVPATGNPTGTNVVISQVYGGGGNTGATYTNDFMELFNPSASSISLAGWSVQYASTAGTTWSRTNLTAVTLQPGQYYLVQQAAGTGGTTPLPTPDATGTTAMAAGAGKVVLVNNQTTITAGTVCPSSGVIDIVGYGSGTTCSETSPTATLTNTTSAQRKVHGCTDTDNNNSDFATGAPLPRNTASTLDPCPNAITLSIDDVSKHEGNAGPTSFDFTVSLSQPAGTGGVTFDIATAPNTATDPPDYTTKSLTGQTIPATQTTYSFSVNVNGDTDVESDDQFFVNVTNVTGASVGDGQGIGTILNDDCGTPYTPIHDIQGNSLSTPIPGTVATEGIVVGDFEGPTSSGLQGVYLQEPTPDADPLTSEGIFVFTGNTNNGLSAGDRVRVSGFVRERFNQTTINGSNSDGAAITSVVTCSTGNPLPAASPVTMPFATLTSPEQYEGMLTIFPQPLVISEYFNYGRFGELVLALPLPGESR